MLPEFARRFEKTQLPQIIEMGTDPAGVEVCLRRRFGDELRTSGDETLLVAVAHVCAAVAAWANDGGAALVVDPQTWLALQESPPAPGAAPFPIHVGVVYVEATPPVVLLFHHRCQPGGVIGWIVEQDGAIVGPMFTKRDPFVPHVVTPCEEMGVPMESGAAVGDWWERHLTGLRNIFALMADRAITEQPINGGHARSITPSERVKAAHRSYTRLSLTEPIRRRVDESPEPTGRHVVAHIRRGHWRRYWVRDPEGRVTLAKKAGKHGDLHEVRQWVRPCKVGDGEPRRREYVVGL
jgi:hypothetical protein